MRKSDYKSVKLMLLGGESCPSAGLSFARKIKMIRNLSVFSIFGFFVITSFTFAGPVFPDLKVVPWNGHKAATSLTFDDGDPSHLDVVVPELNQRKMHGTFYLIANKIDRKDEWRKILLAGHEIGNHTLDHKHANELTPKDEEAQVAGAKNVLQKEFGIPVLTFAYPFVEISPGLKTNVEKTHLLARGGYGTYVMKPEVEPDWMNIPSQTTMTNLTFDTYKTWIDDDVTGGGWLVWMIHGLEGTPWGWNPITKKVFTQILDYLQAKDIWVGTFLEVGSYFRAQKVFEKALTQAGDNEKTLKWQIPQYFPDNVLLKIQADGIKDGFEFWQGKQKITADEKGFYPIVFNRGELTLKVLTTPQK